MPTSAARYDGVAILLHWLIAAAVVANLGLGIWMHEAVEAPATRAAAIAAFQLHKSIGLVVLVLSLLRLAWRFLHPPPPLPADIEPWSRRLAGCVHWAFHGLLVAIPLSGWLYVSAQWLGDAALHVPTLWFGLFEVPHLFALHEAADATRAASARVAGGAHAWLATGLALLLALHVGAALKHQFGDRSAVLVRMLPARRTGGGAAAAPGTFPDANARRRGRFAAAATLVVAVLFVVTGLTTRCAPPPQAFARPDAAALLQGLVAARGAAPEWRVVTTSSAVAFAGIHAGRPFRGRFGRWQAAIRFDPRDPARSRIAAVIETGSASDGVPLHDRTLRGPEWFDVARHPYATFRSTRIRRLGADRYAVDGELRIKDRVVRLPPLVLRVAPDALRIAGSFDLDRADADMGMASDPAGDYVSRIIRVEVDVSAVPGRD